MKNCLALILIVLAAVANVVDSTARACLNNEPPIGSGNITSPNYPQNYDNGANCIYLLQANQSSPGAIIQISFIAFNTEECCDSVYMFDGPSNRSPLIRRLSGTPNGKLIFQSTQPYMTVAFQTDASNTARGFFASYMTNMPPSKPAECPNSFGYPINAGTVMSPNYPAVYSNDMDCLYYLEATAGRGLRLTFNTFDIENLYDFVTIYNGPSTVSPIIVNMSSLTTNPVLTTSGQPYMTLRFKSDSSIVATGFTATYTMF